MWVFDTMREKFEDQHPCRICSSLCGGTLHGGPFGSFILPSNVTDLAVEIGNGEERCGAGQEGSGWSSTLTEGDLPRFKWTPSLLKHKSCGHGQAGAHWGLFCVLMDMFPLMVGGFSSVVLFPTEHSAYAMQTLTVWWSNFWLLFAFAEVSPEFLQAAWLKRLDYPYAGVHTHTHTHTGSPRSAIACPHAFVFNRHAHSLRHACFYLLQNCGNVCCLFKRRPYCHVQKINILPWKWPPPTLLLFKKKILIEV